MSFENTEKSSGTRHKAREAALQMLFAHDLVKTPADVLVKGYWSELGDATLDTPTREFADKLVQGTIANLDAIDERIRKRAEHWRIERMAIVDRNVLRLAVFEIGFHDTPDPVAINEALELARKFSSFEATQFINGLLDAIKQDAEKNAPPEDPLQANSTSAK
jgi:transcription antitermination protein NusB